MTMDNRLTPQNRAVLDIILDEVIPPSEALGIPGAGELGVADFLLTATRYASDPIGAVDRVLTCLAEKTTLFEEIDRAERVLALRAVETEQVDAFATLVRLTYMGYYSRPDTRPLFGLKSDPVHPNGYLVAPESEKFMQKITKPVRARGAIFREP